MCAYSDVHLCAEVDVQYYIATKLSATSLPTSQLNVTMLAHFSSEYFLQLFPFECFNFQEPHKIPTTSKAAAPPATIPTRKEPATVAPPDSAAVINSYVGNQL